ncbi:hypothetical protein EDC01DRAFT_791796 [Geopyxis carbonaria]|nr:hypothetical protein EDC01DRAFT_791796 [Geopyxis carbonaria]
MAAAHVPERVAIITGGASGIGLELAKDILATNNWRVCLVDLARAGPSVAASLSPADRVMYQHCNVASWDEQAAVFAKVFATWGRIDFLAANAGIDDKDSLYGPTASADAPDTPLKPNLITLDVDLVAPIYGLRLATHYMRHNPAPLRGGCVVFTASDAGLYALEGVPQYTAAKHALVGLTRAAGGMLMRNDGISVNAVLPAFVPTGLAPPGLVDAWPKEHRTPMETVLKCFRTFLEHEVTAKCGECSLDTVYFRDQVEWANESQRWGHTDAQKEVWGKVYPS